jgi:hypothetical protein
MTMHGDEELGGLNMVGRLGEVLQTIGGYGFHIYDDGGARWITIRYETEEAARRVNHEHHIGARIRNANRPNG